jgi:hypothetical protein
MDGMSSHSLDADIWELVAAAKRAQRGDMAEQVAALKRAASVEEQRNSGIMLAPVTGVAGSSQLPLTKQPSLPEVTDSSRMPDADISIHKLSAAENATSLELFAADGKAQQEAERAGAADEATESASMLADAAAGTATDDGSGTSACPAITYQSLGRMEGSYSSCGGSSYQRGTSGQLECQETWILLEACDKGSLADALQKGRWVVQLKPLVACDGDRLDDQPVAATSCIYACKGNAKYPAIRVG